MRVAFRADASMEIGSGHVMRCMTLAAALRREGATIVFVSRRLPDHLRARLAAEGFELRLLPDPAADPPDARLAHAGWLGTSQATDARDTVAALDGVVVDWLVVDHYALDQEWEGALRSRCRHLMVIDDLADRKHDCDLLLDQNLVDRLAERYEGLLPLAARSLLGPRYALLQEQYAAFHIAARRRYSVTRILIYFGATQQTGITVKAITGVAALGRPDIAIDVVASSNDPNLREVLAAAAEYPNATVCMDLPSLAELMMRADLCIGGGGATTWERLCLQLPTLVATLAKNQVPIARELNRRRIIRWIGDAANVTTQDLHHALADMMLNLDTYDRADQIVVDGLGARRVSAILALWGRRPHMRAAERTDEDLLLSWSNDTDTRANAFFPERITPDVHARWLRNRLESSDRCRIFIAVSPSGFPVGQVRFERDPENWILSYSIEPSLRGIGLSAPMLAAALENFLMETGSLPVYAKVKLGNERSMKALGRNGFTEVARSDSSVTYTLSDRSRR